MDTVKAKVYYSTSISSELPSTAAKAAQMLESVVRGEKVELVNSLPIKIHPGAVGSTSFIPAGYYSEIINFLTNHGIKPYFVETCMEASQSLRKEEEFTKHGFTQIPFVIADGKEGTEHTEVQISGGKFFRSCLIAKGLAQNPQVLVVSHFKGHSMAGFAGAIKMLGIGFASGRGKTMVHSVNTKLEDHEGINWAEAKKPGEDEYGVTNWNPEVVSEGTIFRQRVAEYALAATTGKKHIYLTLAINLVGDCDCNGSPLPRVYPDLGVFASLDPVAIDTAVFEMLQKREGRKPFAGEEILKYAEKLGMGTTKYELVSVE